MNNGIASCICSIKIEVSAGKFAMSFWHRGAWRSSEELGDAAFITAAIFFGAASVGLLVAALFTATG